MMVDTKSLRRLSSWMRQQNLDMTLPFGCSDPQDAADEIEALRAGLKAVAVALRGAEELFDNYGFADESPCARDRDIVKDMLEALARPGVQELLKK